MLVDKERTEAYVPEQRYPLPLAPAMPDVWELWRRAKTLEWDPQTDIPWEELHPERYSAEQLLAAQMYWSRRTWGEYGAISESPALLLRFCLERRLPDLQFFFTMRTMEEGRHAEASWLMAERLGRYFPQPLARHRGRQRHAGGDRRRPHLVRGRAGRQHARGRDDGVPGISEEDSQADGAVGREHPDVRPPAPGEGLKLKS